MLRRVILISFAVLMAAVMVLTWGSIGSGIMAFCLLIMAAALLYQRFLTNREDDLYQSE